MLIVDNSKSFMITIGRGTTYDMVFENFLTKGNYNTRNPNITAANFPGECIENFNSVLLQTSGNVGYDDAINDMKKMGFRPATMIELLIFGAMCPEEQVRSSIAGLGQQWEDPTNGPVVGSLPHFCGVRDLGLYPLSMPFGYKCRFLAVAAA